MKVLTKKIGKANIVLTRKGHTAIKLLLKPYVVKNLPYEAFNHILLFKNPAGSSSDYCVLTYVKGSDV